MESPKKFGQKRLSMPGLKPSDYFLYDSMQKFLHLDMRGLFVLGLRLIYAGARHPEFREWILRFAHEIYTEDLDRQHEKVVYEDIEKIMTMPL